MTAPLTMPSVCSVISSLPRLVLGHKEFQELHASDKVCATLFEVHRLSSPSCCRGLRDGTPCAHHSGLPVLHFPVSGMPCDVNGTTLCNVSTWILTVQIKVAWHPHMPPSPTRLAAHALAPLHVRQRHTSLKLSPGSCVPILRDLLILKLGHT